MGRVWHIALLLSLAAIALRAEPDRRPLQMQHRALAGAAVASPSNNPYLFLTVPRGRSGAAVQGFEVIPQEDEDAAVEEDDDNGGIMLLRDDELLLPVDDDDEDADEAERPIAVQLISAPNARQAEDPADDDEEDAEEDNDDDEEKQQHKQLSNAPHVKWPAGNLQLLTKNPKSTHMMVSREHAGAIMVPDGVFEIEGQSVIDEKTGKTALLVPRAALEAIPDGSIVALMERSVDEQGEERANRVIVRRRRKGSRRNVRRKNGNRRRRRGGNNKRRRPNNKRNNVRVVRYGGNNRRRRGGNRRNTRRPVRVQG